MDAKELQELLKLVNRLEFAEFKYRLGDLEFSVRTKHYLRSRTGPEAMTSFVNAPQPVAAAPAPPAPVPAKPVTDLDNVTENAATTPPSNNLIEIRSPIVGTFYRSTSPDKPPLIKPGDSIVVGTVVCIVEAMKLFNEIESEVAGKVVKILVEDASPVEYDQLLFLIDPTG
jgi:acetyl-CoA carboxylase biotin carboxyl carrier protein